MIRVPLKYLYLLINKEIIAEGTDKVRVDGISWSKGFYISETSPWKCVFSKNGSECYSILEFVSRRKDCPCDKCDMKNSCLARWRCCDFCRFSEHDHCDACEL